MSNSIVARKYPSSSIRLLLIPVLGLVLLVALCWPAANKANSASLQLSSEAAEVATAPHENHASRPIWPEIHLDQVIACNPFQPLRIHPSAADVETHFDAKSDGIESIDKAATGMPATPGKLQAIYFDARGAAAILDSRVVRIGDILANGRRVVAINAQGVSLDSLK